MMRPQLLLVLVLLVLGLAVTATTPFFSSSSTTTAYVPSSTFAECQSCKCKGTQKPSCPAILQLRYTVQHQQLRSNHQVVMPSPPPATIYPSISSVNVPPEFLQQQPPQSAQPMDQQQQQYPPSPAPGTVMMLPDLKVAGGLLLAGQWDVISSNDVRLRNTPMSIEINADQTVRMITRLHHLGLTYRVSRDAEFELTEGGEMSAEGQLFVTPPKKVVESVLGVGVPTPEDDHPSLMRYGSTRTPNGPVEVERIRLFMESLDTLLILLADHKTFYVLHRSLANTAKAKSTVDSFATPIYVLFTTNLLAYLVPKMLEAMGDEYNEVSNGLQVDGMAHSFLQILHLTS